MFKKMASPAYLWYPKDALSSGRVAELTGLEECWYRRALDHSWLDDGIPADPLKCARRIGKNCTAKAAEMILQTFFVPHKKDALKMVNPRQERERRNLAVKIKQKSEAGKKGMAKRWKQKGKADNTVITEPITENNIPIAIPIAISPSNEGLEERGKNDPPASAFGTPAPRKGNHPALVTVRTLTGHQPDAATWDSLIAILGLEHDVGRLAECYSAWVMKGYKKSNYGWITDWYVNGIEVKNGTNSQPTSERDKQTGRVLRAKSREEELYAIGMAKRAEEAGRSLLGGNDADSSPDAGTSQSAALIR